MTHRQQLAYDIPPWRACVVRTFVPPEYEMLSRWGENFVTELMAGSKKRPLLSGYYRLMEMALQLSIQSGLVSAAGDFGQVRSLVCLLLRHVFTPGNVHPAHSHANWYWVEELSLAWCRL